jgi:uncharacterized Zn ribbon protein
MDIKFKCELKNEDYGTVVGTTIHKNKFGWWFEVATDDWEKVKGEPKLYTQIKDVNGNEIYDGDHVSIVLIIDNFGLNTEIVKGKVVFLEGKWVVDTGNNAYELWNEVYAPKLIK